jgi:hypothetical protein
MAMKSVKQAMDNMEYVRRLLGEKQPRFAASLELAVSQVEKKLRESAKAPRNRRDARCPAAGFPSRAAVKRAVARNIQNSELLELEQPRQAVQAAGAVTGVGMQALSFGAG